MRESGEFLFPPCPGGMPHCPGGRECGHQANRIPLPTQMRGKDTHFMSPCAGVALEGSLSKNGPTLSN